MNDFKSNLRQIEI